MQLLNCPNCGKHAIPPVEKLKIAVDGEGFQCSECGVTFGVFAIVRLLIGVVATAMFFFSFAYFFGRFGFLYGLLCSVVSSFFTLIFLSSACPLFKLKQDNRRQTPIKKL